MGGTFGKTGVGVRRGIQLAFELRKMIDPSKVKVLNSEDPLETENTQEPSGIVDLSKALHKEVLQLKGTFLQEDGTVRYADLRESPDYAHFRRQCGRLKGVDLSPLGESERKAFFLNIYNTLTVHALAENVTSEKSVLQLEKFWQMHAYNIGGLNFSLDDVEHGVLRCNQKHPTIKECFFKEGDPRRAFVMAELDPRIHFALNCGAKSCPPIRLFSSENLDNALDLAAKNFCQNDVTINSEKREVCVSKILQWYGNDFGHDEKAVTERILPYFGTEQKAELEKISDRFNLVFSDYDWTIH